MNIFDRNYFLIVNHRALNATNPRLEDLAKRTEELGKYTGNRKTIIGIEGDVAEHNGELYLAHQFSNKDFIEFNNSKAKGTNDSKLHKYISEGKASHFEKTIENIAKNKTTDTDPHLIIELKSYITLEGMKKVSKILKDHNIENFHYDGFFGKTLNIAHKADSQACISHHLFSNIGSAKIPVPVIGNIDFEPNIYTVPFIFSKGIPSDNTIYGALYNEKWLEKAAQDIRVIGGYDLLDQKSFFQALGKYTSH